MKNLIFLLFSISLLILSLNASNEKNCDCSELSKSRLNENNAENFCDCFCIQMESSSSIEIASKKCSSLEKRQPPPPTPPPCQYLSAVMGNGFGGSVRSFTKFRGDYYAAGKFGGPTDTVVQTRMNNIAKFASNASDWDRLGTFPNVGVEATGNVSTMVVFKDLLYVAGFFRSAGGQTASHITRFDGTGFDPMTNKNFNGAFDPDIRVMVANSDYLFVGGVFDSVGGVSVNNIAQFDGTNWARLGNGSQIGTNGRVHAIATMGYDVYIGGEFSMVDGKSTNRIARWDGVGKAWYNLTGATFDNDIRALAVINSTLYVGGFFNSPYARLTQWDGSNWNRVGSSDLMGTGVFVFHVYGMNLYIGLYYSPSAGSNLSLLLKWNGLAFDSNLGFLMNAYFNTLYYDNEILFIGGDFTMVNNIYFNRIFQYGCFSTLPSAPATPPIYDVTFDTNRSDANNNQAKILLVLIAIISATIIAL